MSQPTLPVNPSDNVDGLRKLFETRNAELESKHGAEKELSVAVTLADSISTAHLTPIGKEDTTISKAEEAEIRKDFLNKYGKILRGKIIIPAVFNSSNIAQLEKSLKGFIEERQKDFYVARIDQRVAALQRQSPDHFRKVQLPPLPDFFDSIPTHHSQLRGKVDKAVSQMDENLALFLANEKLLSHDNPQKFEDALKLLSFYQDYNYQGGFAYALCLRIPAATGLLRSEGEKINDELLSPHSERLKLQYSDRILRILRRVDALIQERYPEVNRTVTEEEISDFRKKPYESLPLLTRLKIQHSWLKAEIDEYIRGGAELPLQQRERVAFIESDLETKSRKYRNNANEIYPVAHLRRDQLAGLDETTIQGLLEKSQKGENLDRDDIENLQLSNDENIRIQAFYILAINYDKISVLPNRIVDDRGIQQMRERITANHQLRNEIFDSESEMATLFSKSNYGELAVTRYRSFKDFSGVDQFLDTMLQLTSKFVTTEQRELRKVEGFNDKPWNVAWAAKKLSSQKTASGQADPQVTAEQSQSRINSTFYTSDGRVYVKDERVSANPYLRERKVEVFDVYTEDPETKSRKYEGKEVLDLFAFTDPNGFTKNGSPKMQTIRSWYFGPGRAYPIGTLVMNFKSSSSGVIYLTPKERRVHRHEFGHLDEVTFAKDIPDDSAEYMSTNLEGRYSVNESTGQRDTTLQPKTGEAYEVWLKTIMTALLWNELRKNPKKPYQDVMSDVLEKVRKAGIPYNDVLHADFIAAKLHIGKQAIYGADYSPGDMINLFNQRFDDKTFFKIFHYVEAQSPFESNFMIRYQKALRKFAPAEAGIATLADVTREVMKQVK